MAARLPKKADRLEEYRRKRAADRTPEPFTASPAGRAKLFVVQKHAARSMHYDFRLEMGGALQSWAVPKGPSLDPEVKRLAVEVEEHPLEYADFEGIIPEGNYGAGAVVVWDRGRWDPIGDPAEGMEKGKLLFDLHGYKLRGRWTLFRTKGKPKHWLLMKKPDAESGAGRTLPEESIRSGLTVEQLRDGFDPTARIRRTLRGLRAPRRCVAFERLEPMLAGNAEAPFSGRGWLFELKYDGYRLLAGRKGDDVRLRFRRGGNATAVFPELASALRALPFESLILDGEVVVLDDTGRPSFQRLQQRTGFTRRSDIAGSTVQRPASFFVFDLPAFDGYDLRTLPLDHRKRVLRNVLPPHGPLRYCDHVETDGESMFEEVVRLRLEGLVAKRADSPYVSRRSASWLKIRADRTDDFVVVGHSPPKGSRSGFGALHLAARDGEELVYTGRVGSGFSDRLLEELTAALSSLERPSPACSGPLPTDEGHAWVEPRIVCEVRYKERTDEGLLRQPVFLRLRDDVPPEDCRLPGAPVAAPGAAGEMGGPEPRTVSFTNLGKVFWPEERYTKGDLIEYYRTIAPWLLPYLAGRPVVLTRYPDGIEGKSFFQKDAPGFAPVWLRTLRLWSEHAKREIHYFVADDVESLLYLINLGTIPLHLWSSRVDTLQQPDWCILDLDPKGAPFANVVKVARLIHDLCGRLDLPCFVKTSGSSGLHVLIPLDGSFTYEQSRTLGELLARIVVGELHEIATVRRALSAREGRVYVDFLQNGHGRLLVAPFSVRPLPGAPVSTPLRWREVRPALDQRRFTIRSVPRRMRSLKQDPLLPVLETRPDLESALNRLGRLLHGS